VRFQASGCFSPPGRPASGFERLPQQPIFDLIRGAAGERATAGKKPREGPKGGAQSRRALKSRQSTRSKPTPRFNLLGPAVSGGAHSPVEPLFRWGPFNEGDFLFRQRQGLSFPKIKNDRQYEQGQQQCAQHAAHHRRRQALHHFRTRARTPENR